MLFPCLNWVSLIAASLTLPSLLFDRYDKMVTKSTAVYRQKLLNNPTAWAGALFSLANLRAINR
jgi:hypothetical protein